MPDIKIFVSCHKDSFVPDNPLLYKIQVGTALSKTRLDSALHDDDGDNISNKNKAYCELTAQYWAWKNVQAEYYGFFHYRRYLSFQEEYPVQQNGRVSAKKILPYQLCETPAAGVETFGITSEQIEKITTKYDIITVLREKSNSTAYEQYCQFHKKEDIDRILKILKEMHPEYTEAADCYMASKQLYFMNMYIMRKSLFFAYMEWLFPVLEEFEARTDFSDYSEQEYRACAYLAERLFGIWFTYMKKNSDKRCCELPYIMFENTEPKPVIQPAFRGDSIDIVMAADNCFVPYLAVALQSLLEHSSESNCYDIVIFHTKIPTELQRRVTMLGKGRSNVSIRFCNISSYVQNIPFYAQQHISVETFYRYFIMELLPEYKKVLYLDSDIVVLKDVADLYRTDVSHSLLAAAKDMDVIGTYKSKKEMQRYLEEKLLLEEPLDYFQAGVLVMNLETLRKEVSTSALIEKTLEFKWSFVDQDVLNQICKGRVTFLNQSWNVLMDWNYSMHTRMELMSCAPRKLWQEYCEARENPFIIHYAGAWKPWNTPNCDFAEEFWQVARRSPFYEWILYENMQGDNRKRSLHDNGTKRVFRLKPTKIELMVDMKKVNRILPAGSLRRRFVRALLKKWL